MPTPACIATWPFGQDAVRATLPLLQKGRGALEAAIAGAQVVEEGTNSHSVGYGGLPNEDGEVELDASVMHGPTHRAGSVASVRRIDKYRQFGQLNLDVLEFIQLLGVAVSLHDEALKRLALWAGRQPAAWEDRRGAIPW